MHDVPVSGERDRAGGLLCLPRLHCGDEGARISFNGWTMDRNPNGVPATADERPRLLRILIRRGFRSRAGGFGRLPSYRASPLRAFPTRNFIVPNAKGVRR